MTDSDVALPLDVFYERYVTACAELGAAPLPPDHLLALIDALVKRTTPTVT